MPEIMHKGHLRSLSTSKSGKLPYDLHCKGATFNPTKTNKIEIKGVTQLMPKT
jgi:hypothetical protein